MTAFAEPWEAQAFALVVAMHARGLFSWPQWSEALAAQIARAPDAPYYESWLAALERFVCERGLIDAGTLADYREAWARAAARTPHGQPIELRR